MALGLYWGDVEPNQSVSQLLLNDTPAVGEWYFMSASSEQKLSSLNVINERLKVFIKHSGVLEASG